MTEVERCPYCGSVVPRGHNSWLRSFDQTVADTIVHDSRIVVVPEAIVDVPNECIECGSPLAAMEAVIRPDDRYIELHIEPDAAGRAVGVMLEIAWIRKEQ